jgi:hypothetical protein
MTGTPAIRLDAVEHVGVNAAMSAAPCVHRRRRIIARRTGSVREVVDPSSNDGLSFGAANFAPCRERSGDTRFFFLSQRLRPRPLGG